MDLVPLIARPAASRVVLAQLEGSGRGALGSYNAKASQALTEHLTDVPLKDADAWLESLMRKDEMLGAPPARSSLP